MTEFVLCIAFIGQGALWYTIGVIVERKRSLRREASIVENIIRQVALNSHK